GLMANRLGQISALVNLVWQAIKVPIALAFGKEPRSGSSTMHFPQSALPVRIYFLEDSLSGLPSP
ncbi:unnamed protein product, partial [marine sediment metagenome]